MCLLQTVPLMILLCILKLDYCQFKKGLPDFTLNLYLFVSLIVFVAIFVRTLTGLGGALISVSILSLFLPFKFVVGLDTLIETLVLSFYVGYIYKHARFIEVKPVAIGAFFGTILGAIFLTNYSEDVLKTTLGVVIILSVALLLVEQNKHIKMPYKAGYFFGLLGGSFGSAVGSTAPPFAVFLSGRVSNKDVLRASILSLVLVVSLFRSFVFSLNGVITVTTIYWVFAVFPVVLAATYLSNEFSYVVTSATLKKTIIGIIFLLGIGLILV